MLSIFEYSWIREINEIVLNRHENIPCCNPLNSVQIKLAIYLAPSFSQEGAHILCCYARANPVAGSQNNTSGSLKGHVSISCIFYLWFHVIQSILHLLHRASWSLAFMCSPGPQRTNRWFQAGAETL